MVLRDLRLAVYPVVPKKLFQFYRTIGSYVKIMSFQDGSQVNHPRDIHAIGLMPFYAHKMY